MELISTKISPFIGVSGEDPVEKDAKALEHAKILGQTMVRALKEKTVSPSY